MASITYNNCILIEKSFAFLNTSKWDHYPSSLILHSLPIAWYQYSHSDYILYKILKKVKTPRSLSQQFWHSSQMFIPTQFWLCPAFPPFGRGYKAALRSQLLSLWLHPATPQLPIPHGSKARRGVQGTLGFCYWATLPASHFGGWSPAPFHPEEEVTVDGISVLLPLTETMSETLNVQTRTFVLKIVHKVLVPGIQRTQGFFQRQPESFSLPQVCLDWVKCLTVLPLNGWFPVVI